MSNSSNRSKTVRNSMSRLFFAAIAVLIQVIWLITLVIKLNKYSAGISLLTSLVAFVLVLKIYGRDINSAMKMPWIMMIMVFPVMGVCLYFLCGNSGVNGVMRRHFQTIQDELKDKVCQKPEVLETLRQTDAGIGNQAWYIWHSGNYPICKNTDVVFYPEAVDGFKAQKKAIEDAEHFIFMEYHAIEDAESFGGLKALLIEKARQGVEVRIIYDDMGSIGFISPDFVKHMEAVGIPCRIFNRIMPMLNIFMNNRDHRKITVIDGRVGFTGGYNLADEYFNITHPYGQWKDTGIRLEGDGVKSLTVMFLEMWNAIKKTDQDYDGYLPEVSYEAKTGGYVQPYADNPLDEERMGENVYLNMIKNAKRYIYFTTPYLIISDEMKRELCLAAKRGVDVRIITPGIPDKKTVFQVTRSYYAGLVKDGVRIYEYTPGFCHAKQCVCDDEAATVGTINLDFRSLYLHFENGVFLYDCPAIADIRADFEDTFAISEEVTDKYAGERSRILRIGQCLLRLFAPLL